MLTSAEHFANLDEARICGKTEPIVETVERFVDELVGSEVQIRV